jgi:copper homeostasis protein (lipoprotein)
MRNNILLLLLLTMISCQRQSKNDSVTNMLSNSHNAKNSLDYIGIYKGILPCADCEGLETEIVINENATYSLKTKYQGKGNKIFLQKGSFTWNKNGNTIILNNIENSPNQYFVSKNTLTQLNLSGQRIIGKLANDYILSKQPIVTTTIENVVENNATVYLNNRIQTTTVIQKVNPAIGKFTLAETKWKLISLYNTTISQKLKNIFYLKLNSKDGRFNAYMGCNSIAGSYAMPSPYKLFFLEVIMTKMACPEMTLEANFSSILAKANSYKIDDGMLILLGEKKKVLAKFRAVK